MLILCLSLILAVVDCSASLLNLKQQPDNSKLTIGERLARRFNNANLTSIPDHPDLWDILRLPTDAIAESEIFNFLGKMFGSDEKHWMMSWLMDNNLLDEKNKQLAEARLLEVQLCHGLRMKDYPLTRRVLRNLKKKYYHYFDKDEVKGYGDYLFDNLETDGLTQEMVLDFSLYYKQFSRAHIWFISPKATLELLSRFLPEILIDNGKFLTLGNGIGTDDLSNINSSETMLKIHGRNAEVFRNAANITNIKKSFLECLLIVNDILFLPHSSVKTKKVIEDLNQFERRNGKIVGSFKLSDQPFFHHSAINADEPEIFEAVEALFPIYTSRSGDNFIIYSGHKWRCFERMSDAYLMKYLNFDGQLFRELVSSGLDRHDAATFSRGEVKGKYEAPKLSFRSYNGGFPAGIVGVKRAHLMTQNLRYLLESRDLPIERVFTFISVFKNEPEILMPGSFKINADRLLQVLEYDDQDGVTELFQILDSKVDLVLENVSDDRRLKHLNYILNSDSGFDLLMKHRPSLANVLAFTLSKAVDGLPIHKVRRFFNFIGAPVTGCAGNNTTFNIACNYCISWQSIKISQLHKHFNVEEDLLPKIAYSIGCESESAYAFTTVEKNIGLYTLWFQENPVSYLRWGGTVDMLKLVKHRVTKEQVEAARKSVSSDRSYRLENINKVFPENWQYEAVN